MKVIIAAAGTGGHINPGIAIANIIEKNYPNSDIRFIATGKELEEDLISKGGYKSYAIQAYGFKKSLTIENIKNDIKTIKGFKQAKKILEEFKPDIVIGTGGYICGAVISSAKKLGIPTLLHESNAYPGLAIRLLSRKVDTILVGIQEAKEGLKHAKRVVYTGTPTKVKPLNLSLSDKKRIIKELNISDKLPILLVFGGSQGAKKINDCVINIIENFMNKDYQIVWSTGAVQYDVIKEELNKKNIDIENIKNAKILPYIYNMDEVMSISDLVVARSGALTLTELALLGKPAIFIPLPSSSANRQEDNARVFEKQGAAKIILNTEVTSDNLNEMIESIILDKDKLKEMSLASSKLAITDVEDRILNEIKRLIKE
ncbi:MAG: undecaprenyldiphospho-muramoylpentapeptide beta-N-acetylglucosaminyltransferase [Bacilli bacterium]|nr:undecaprenyldiphospho-muramoylpentapeptide beta-N-acetylglucosaminyltransferase [Bacilli bacterium]